MFNWELDFMICSGLPLIRLSRPHDSRIMPNELTRVDLTHFLYHFLLKIFTNFIIQHWIWQGQLGIEFYNLFWFTLCGVFLVSWSESYNWQVNLVQIKSFFNFFFYEVILVSFQVISLVNWLELFFYIIVLIDLFFKLIIQYWVDWVLNVIICFDLLFMILYRSCDLGCRFNKLTQVLF